MAVATLRAVASLAKRVQIGCCGFGLAQPAYFRTFSCLEIDSTFYQLPKLTTVERWRAMAPPGFQFTLKAWQVITHRASSPTYRRTKLEEHDRQHAGHFGFNATIRWAWDETYRVARALDAAVVLFQTPASFTPNKEHIAKLRQFFERAKRGSLRFAWEPRGAGWEPVVVEKLCRDLDLIHAVDPFRELPAAPGKLQYYRLHGVTGSKHRYADEELAKLREVTRQSAACFVMFNNLSRAADARRFAAIAGSNG
jgi:uncharacterized protein YecE (DUF72 family)